MSLGNSRLRVLTGLIGVTAVIAVRLPTIQTEARADSQPVAQLAMQFGQWQGAAEAVAPDVQRALPTARILSRRYHCPAGVADVTIVSGSDATALHDPHDCLTGDGWQFLREQSRTVDVGGGAGPVRVRDVEMARGPVQARMWYWYAVGTEMYDRTLSARLGLFHARLMEGQRRRAQFVRLIVPGETNSARTTFMLSDLARHIAGR